MDERDDAARLAPRERTTGLSAAILRIGATLDLDTVLNKVVESARAPTGAAYGVIATVDEGGEPRDFVTSGFTPEEHRTMEAWPDRPALSADDAAMPDRSKMPPPRRVSAGLFEHFRALPGPLRVDNLSGYVRALGIEQDTAAPGYERRGEPAAPDGEFRQSSRLPLNNRVHAPSGASGPCAQEFNHGAPSLSASAVVVARRFAAHASRSDLLYRTRLPNRWKAGPSPLTR